MAVFIKPRFYLTIKPRRLMTKPKLPRSIVPIGRYYTAQGVSLYFSKVPRKLKFRTRRAAKKFFCDGVKTLGSVYGRMPRVRT